MNLQTIAGLAHLFTVGTKVGKALNMSLNVFPRFAQFLVYLATNIAGPHIV